jgi:DDE superfamily endonuclease
MWDMTDLPISKPSDAEMQSNTHSSYFGGNVAKGGISLQQCGWIRLALLWQGGITDSDYIIRAGILEMQKKFIETHDERSCNVKFVIIVDKGFRITHAAWAAGNQTVLQPHFAKADTKFTGNQTLYSASVASDRGGNERAVRLSKKAGFLSRGLQPRAGVDRYCDSWFTWGFQIKFMYKPVL